MAFIDFLTEGQPIPAGSGVRDLTSTTALPEWYTNYAMQLLSDQTAVGATPYSSFPGARVAGFTPDQQAAFDAARTGATAGQGALSTAIDRTTGSAGVSGLAAAQPYFNTASKTSVSNIGDYLNPYTNDVVNRLGDVAGRTLREKLLPAVNDSFISAGQAGSSRNAEILGRTLRDVSESTTAAQKGALQEGYGQALTASGVDLNRAGDIGRNVGALAQQDATTGLAGGLQLAKLGEQQQDMALKGAGALSTIGGAQQSLDQKNIDTAMADFLTQKGYPQSQIDAMLKTLTGVGAAGAVPKSVNESGVEPMQNQGYAPSGLSQIGSAATGIAAIANLFK